MITAAGYKTIAQVLAGEKRLTEAFTFVFSELPWTGGDLEGHEVEASVRASDNKSIYYCTLPLEVQLEIQSIGLKHGSELIAVEELPTKIIKTDEMNLPIDFVLTFGRAAESVVIQSGVTYTVENDTTLVEKTS